MSKALWNRGSWLAALLLVSTCFGCATSSQERATLDPPLLAEVNTFLSQHQEFGEATATQAVDNWARGKRQRVTFDSGRNLLFYTEGGRVTTVYEDDSVEGRKKVWGE